MITRTKEDFLKAAGIGKEWRLFFRQPPCGFEDCSELIVRMDSLNKDSFNCITHDGVELNIKWDNIFAAETDRASVELTEVRTACTEWYRSIKNLLLQQSFSLIRAYRDTFNKMASELDNEGSRSARNILLASRTSELRGQYIRNQSELQEYMDSVRKIKSWNKFSISEQNAAIALLRLVGRDYIGALNDLIPDAALNEKSEMLFPLACYFNDIKDKASSFYWLKKYFSNNTSIEGFMSTDGDLDWTGDKPAWWLYLRLAVYFDYYSDIFQQIATLVNINPEFAANSLAFLFCERGNRYIAEQVYAIGHSNPNSLSYELLTGFFSMLDYNAQFQDWSSYYYRFHLLANRILNSSNPLYRKYTVDYDLEGFVFDYVDSRNYCLVLGYDMIPYFLYLDDETRPGDTTSARIRKRIRREMNILTPVSKETPIHLVFDRVSDVEATKSRISIYNAKLL